MHHRIKQNAIVETTCNRPDCIITGIAGKKGFVSITIDKDMMNSEIGFGTVPYFEDNGIPRAHAFRHRYYDSFCSSG